MNCAPTRVGFAPNCCVGARFIAPLFVAPIFLVRGSVTKLAERLIFTMHALNVFCGAFGRDELRPYAGRFRPELWRRGAIHRALVYRAHIYRVRFCNQACGAFNFHNARPKCLLWRIRAH